MGWIGLIWLSTGTSGGLLWTRYWTFGFHKILGISWVAAQLAASQEGLSSMSEWEIKIKILQIKVIAQSKICYEIPGLMWKLNKKYKDINKCFTSVRSWLHLLNGLTSFWKQLAKGSKETAFISAITFPLMSATFWSLFPFQRSVRLSKEKSSTKKLGIVLTSLDGYSCSTVSLCETNFAQIFFFR
jgi:hypothetical protein